MTSEGLIDRDDLLDVLSEVIKPESGDEPRRIAELFLEYAGRRSGLLLPRGQDASGRDRYAFIHLSFQEYFAAQFLRDCVCDPDWLELDDENEEHGTRLQDVRRYAGQALWRETLIFLWESATPHFTSASQAAAGTAVRLEARRSSLERLRGSNDRRVEIDWSEERVAPIRSDGGAGGRVVSESARLFR